MQVYPVQAKVVQATYVNAQPIAVVTPDVANSMDVIAFTNLARINNLEFKQGNVFWEAWSGGAAANTYMIKDRISDTPLFIMEEESSCWCRVCCNPGKEIFCWAQHNKFF